MSVPSIGFTKMEVGAPEGSTRLTIERVAAAINFQVEDRGIKWSRVSEALEMSRDIIISEAVWSLGGRWDIVGDTLRVWPAEFGDAWPFTEAS